MAEVERVSDESWMEDAACKGHEPSLYDEQFKQLPPPQVRCGRCPVIAFCLTFALRNGYEGVWGGTTIEGRRKLGRRQHRARCPGRNCNGREIKRGSRMDTCLSCGLSWPAPKS